MNSKILKEYRLEKSRYKELEYMCYQYKDLKQQLEGISELSAVSIDGLPGGTKISDPVGNLAVKRDKIVDKVKAIESAAELLGDLGKGVLRSVTEGFSYDYLKANGILYCGRRQYYEARQMFFWYLDKKI